MLNEERIKKLVTKRDILCKNFGQTIWSPCLIQKNITCFSQHSIRSMLLIHLQHVFLRKLWQHFWQNNLNIFLKIGVKNKNTFFYK
jgi:hypothetical protein